LKIEGIKKHLVPLILLILLLIGQIYLKHYYTPKYSPYENEAFLKMVDNYDSDINYINNHIDNPTLESITRVRIDIRQILHDDQALINKQTIINKIIKNKYTLTQSQTEILKNKYDNVFQLEEKFTISVLEKIFHVKDFSPILEDAKQNNEYQSKSINVKHKDQEYDILLKGGSIFFTHRSTHPEEESLESIISRRFFLIDTGDQKYYLRMPPESSVSADEKRVVVKSDILNFNLIGNVYYDTMD